jgi:radical SAM superfamily enzyme YgiQ (UPF0313 family)
MSLPPPVIAIFSRLLKDIDVNVALFDTTLYNKKLEDSDADAIREKNLAVISFLDNLNEMKDKIGYKDADILDDLEKKVNDFKPNLLAATVTESTFKNTIRLLKHIRGHRIPTLIGGVFATFAPDIAIACPEVDMICIGEGETAIVDLTQRMRSGKNYCNVSNLWVKRDDGSVVKNSLARLAKLDDIPVSDMSIFEAGRFYRAIGGKISKTFPVETHRGCTFRCAFCSSPLNNKMYKEQTNQIFFRYKSINKVYKEIRYYNDLGAEYLFFWADNFFDYPQRAIDEFCEMYSEFKIPFYCQARPEGLSSKKIKKLKAAGMQRIGIGIEHGNEKFRKEVLGKEYSNRLLINNLKILTNFGLEYSVNNIIGFPDETPELAMDTIEINRQHQAINIGCSIYAPFHGTALRELALQRGYLKSDDVLAPSNNAATILNMPQFTPEQILGKRRTFCMYVKFPKSRWKEISLAESLTPEGDAEWEGLRKEFISTYF